MDEEADFQNPQSVKESLRAVFRVGYPDCRRIIDDGRTIQIYVRASEKSYRLTTLWNFTFSGPCLRICVSFYNKAENDLLRALTYRMAIEMSILLRKINPNFREGLLFRIEPSSKSLQLFYSITWAKFHQLYYGK